MAERTGIEWCNHTFSPWRGCTRVSEGCQFCYAETLSGRNPKVLGTWGPNGTRVRAADQQWREPIRWDRAAREAGARRRVFCASLADVFEDWPGQMVHSNGLPAYVHEPTGAAMSVPGGYGPQAEGGYADRWTPRPFTLDDARAKLWELIRQTPNLDWQLLTKRPENIARMMPPGNWPNVWLGVSVESQEYVWRLDALQEAPQQVPVHFCSAEPLLEPLGLLPVLGPTGINWVIIGGESGGQARQCHVEWVRRLVSQCREADIATFVKQLGRHPAGMHPLPLADSKGGDWDEWPADLRIRKFPDL